MDTFQIIGINDSKDFCECCGRKGLKRVVWILHVESGAEHHFGTTCAMSPSKGFGLDKEIKAAMREHDHSMKVRRHVAMRAYVAAGGTYESISPGQWRATNLALLDECLAKAVDNA
jgi:hypothetical protein